jgi:hypothetical protein
MLHRVSPFMTNAFRIAEPAEDFGIQQGRSLPVDSHDRKARGRSGSA